MKTTHNKKKGRVYLVGAGPGRADLITVRGAQVLKTADCIICDKLANPSLLKFVRPDAEIVHVPKRIGEGSFTQEEINNLLLEKAGNGQTVVRLKGGDPCIFGRGTEEAKILAENRIDFEIVPGITAGIAAAAYAGLILTDRNYSSQVVLVTGKEADGKQTSNIDWHWLAKFRGTIIFYMAMGNLDFIAEQLIKNGMEEETPSVVITNVSLPSQRTVSGSLRQLDEKCKQQTVGPPSIVIIGAAAGSDRCLNWFMKKPLFGRNIVVTRDEKGNADFADKIISQGANPLEFPTIKIKPLTHTNKFLRTLAEIAEFDWVIFTSPNGVTVFFECLRSLARDGRIFGSAKIAAIGSETAAKLGEFGIRADFVSGVFSGKELGKQLTSHANLQDKKILLLRSELASNELTEVLIKAKAEVKEAPVYTVTPEKSDCTWLKEAIAERTINWLTFASPSSANVFFEQIEGDLVNSSGVKVASIGPVTSEQLKNLGVKVDAEAAVHTIDGLLTAIEEKDSV